MCENKDCKDKECKERQIQSDEDENGSDEAPDATNFVEFGDDDGDTGVRVFFFLHIWGLGIFEGFEGCLFWWFLEICRFVWRNLWDCKN